MGLGVGAARLGKDVALGVPEVVGRGHNFFPPLQEKWDMELLLRSFLLPSHDPEAQSGPPRERDLGKP